MFVQGHAINVRIKHHKHLGHLGGDEILVITDQ